MPTLYVCFLQNDVELMESHWLNRMAAYLAPKSEHTPKIHVELFFPDNTRHDDIVEGKACSIHYGGRVFMQKKRFSRKQWSFRTLNVTHEQYKKIQMFCEGHTGNSFNYLGYYLQPINVFGLHPYTFTYVGMNPRWFCSEICIEALKAGGVLKDHISPSIHPQSLFEMLEDSTTVDCVRNYNQLDIQF